jgi:hypothetical protein
MITTIMNAFYFTQRTAARFFAAIAMFSLIAGMVPAQALAATQTSPYGSSTISKVDLCHSNEGNHGFNALNVSVSSSGAPQGGHANDESDIIPPYFYTGTDHQKHFYQGSHWTQANQVIWNGGACNGASLTVTKVVSGGTAQPNDFNLKVGTMAVQSGVAKTFSAGSYTVSETNLANYIAGVWGGDCTSIGQVTLAVGQSKTCTITNTYVPPPVACQAPYTGFEPTCVPPPCPTGTTGVYPACVQILPPSCTDGIQNQDETGVDTGGVCAPPPVACQAPYTGFEPTCVPPPCPTGTTGVYPACTPIPPICDTGTHLSGNQCVADSCTDGIQNQNETVVDAGGICAPAQVLGCTNPSATNYNPSATVDNADAANCDLNYVSQCGENPNLLVNGSFEDDHSLTAGTWGIFNNPLGWAVSNDGLEYWNHLFITPSNGDQNVELDGNSPSTISQTVTTIPGATYELRFDFAARSDASSAADNHIKVTTDGATVVDHSTTNTKWTTYGGTFVADSSTDISLADMGTPNSYGTLVDNAVLCLVKEPVVDYCPNIKGDQTADEGYLKDTSGACYRTTDECKVTVVSDASAFVVEKDTTASLLSFIHPAWTANIPGASWIWGDNPVVDPSVSTTQTFQNKFGFVGTVTSATLEVASDNGHSAALNVSAAHAAGSSFGSALMYNVTTEILQGNNILNVAVTNDPLGTDPAANPAGALYKLTITGTPTTDADCSVPYTTENTGGGGPVLGCTDPNALNYNPAATVDNAEAGNCTYPVDTYKIYGFVWHDNNDNQTWDGRGEGGESPLAGWSVSITDGETTMSTTTDASGYYYFNVPAGTWTITETVQNGWGRTTQESYVVTVPAPQVLTLLDTVTNFFVPTAFAAVANPAFGEYNFGNDEQSSGGGGSVRHGSSGGGSTPSGEVLGASTEAPKGEVLGAQVAVVPAGAPNTGAGGTSPFALNYIQVVPVAFFRRTKVHG